MKYLIISDTHGLVDEFLDISLHYKDLAGKIHCGDSELDASYLDGYHAVLGNNDYNGLPDKLVVQLGSHKALIVHSHRQSFFNRQDQLAYFAKSEGCDICFFGHTHAYFDKVVKKIRLINPGSLHHNRDGRGSTYGILEINDEDEISFELIELKK